MQKRILGVSAIVAALLCAVYWWWQRPAKLSESDSLLVGELANESGEKDFDGSLREALRVALLQSPYLNLLSDEKIRATMRVLGRPEGTPVDATVASGICQKAGAQAYLTGQISRTSNGYQIELNAYGCHDGRRMASAEAAAPRADLAVQHLGEAVRKLREKLGEDAASIKKYDVPLERATTPIPAALKAYTDARKAIQEKGDLEPVPFYKQAIELDSRFAMAHSGLAVSY